ncbi:MAG: type II toxin-antitoxin system RelE/ParE family toxin [Nanoarchaeota archaeon]
MTYLIEWESNSAEEISNLPKEIALRIYNKIEEASNNPDHFLEKLEGIPEFKIRIGDYRAILLWDQASKKLKIQTIGHRKNIYKRYKTT